MSAKPATTQDNKAWSAQADEYAKLTQKTKSASAIQPMALPTQIMLQTLNKVKPLSTASAVMDAGCGTGYAMTTLVENFGSEIPPSARIIASDFSEGMVNVFRQIASSKAEEGTSIWSRLETTVLDLQDLSPLHDGMLSHVFSSFVFGIVQDNAKALREVNRVLAPGGVLAEVAFSKITWKDWIDDSIEKIWPGKSNPVPWPAELKNEASIKTLFEGAGFESVETQEVDSVMAMDDIPGFVRIFSRSSNPAMRLAFKYVKDNEREQVENFLEEDLHKRFSDGRVRMVSRAIIAVGFKK